MLRMAVADAAVREPSLLAASHPRQAERIAALRSYDILDTPREADFDDIVQLASRICETPISVVNLIDADRQWFKAEVGLGVRETPLDTSLCAHAILEREFMEIPDTLADCRMQDNALCTSDPGLRFYAGALLKTDEGLPLGTLCVLDFKPRELNSLQKETLQVLAKQIMAQLNLRAALARQELLRKEIDHRVKNSLASVAAMVKLQIARAKEPALRSALDAVEHRVRTVALLHEELYRTSEFDRIELSRYLGTIQEMLQESAPAGVSIQLEAAPLVVASSQAAAVGVIVSEFVINSFKYAFPEGRPGRISLKLEVDGDAARLMCRDDGIGANIDAVKRGLGLRLIEAYALQVGGKARFSDAAPGLALAVTFPS